MLLIKTLSVKKDKSERGYKDNLREVTVYALKHLEQEGAAFIKLRYELELQLFMPSDLMGPKHILKRLEFLDECMIGNAKNSFNKALEHTRGEFVESANVSNEN